MHPSHYLGPSLRGRRLLPAAVPAPIHQVLRAAGLLEDPNLGLNSLKARWVEEQFWIYRHTFTVPAEAAEQPAWLVFDKLELDTLVLLNGQEGGRHANANRPARFAVTGKLRPGENLLVVRVDAGFHSAADKPGNGFCSGEIGLLTKRHWHRNPQYQVGWDWNARLTNVGILGDVRLEWSAVPRLDQVTLFASRAPTYHRHPLRSGVHRGCCRGAGSRRCALASWRPARKSLPLSVVQGESRHELQLEIANPRPGGRLGTASSSATRWR